MIIENEIKTRKILFNRIELVKDHYPSCQVKIGIETENIKSNYDDSIWLSFEDIEKFLVELEELDESRKGQATLDSMSPGEMILSFRSIDNLGHLSTTLQIVKEKSISNDYSFDIKVEFQIDSTSLISIRNEFQKLME